jgi:hypothetical protein
MSLDLMLTACSNRRYLSLTLLICCLRGLPAGAALSRQVVAYRIHAELDPRFPLP